MGSIYSYENSAGQRLYRIVYRKPDNRQTQERGFKRKRDAEVRLSEVELSKHRGEFVSPAEGMALIQDLGEQWLKSK